MKQAPTITDLPPRLPGEDDKTYWWRMARWFVHGDARSKVDLREWTGSYPFHLNRED